MLEVHIVNNRWSITLFCRAFVHVSRVFIYSVIGVILWILLPSMWEWRHLYIVTGKVFITLWSVAYRRNNICFRVYPFVTDDDTYVYNVFAYIYICLYVEMWTLLYVLTKYNMITFIRFIMYSSTLQFFHPFVKFAVVYHSPQISVVFPTCGQQFR
jgi:hypothetical protein